MRSLFKSALFGAAVIMAAATSGTVRAEAYCYTLDPEHLLVGFLVDHVGFAKTFGQFDKVTGSFCFDEQSRALSDVRITMEAASVNTHHSARDRHLRSKDFLNADKFPQITFAGTASNPTGERKGTVTGDLTLLGRTMPLTLDVVWNKSGAYPFGEKHYAIGISARGSLKRSAYGMTYGVAEKLVGDDVEILIEFEGKRGERKK